MANKQNFFGLTLAPAAREKLRGAGIFVQTLITVEHQHLARRYVVRGIESGGAVEAFGHYVSFAAEDGSPLPYLCPVESLAVNGPHAVVVEPVLLRAEMLRAGHTYELLITRHQVDTSRNGKKPGLKSSRVFRGEHGYLADGAAGPPVFMTRAGEALPLPEFLVGVVEGLASAVRCIGCTHPHCLIAPADDGIETLVAITQKSL